MKIEILGTGCYHCIQLEALVNEILSELGITGMEVVRISDEKTIRKFMLPDDIPGLVINGHLISTRQLPDRETLLHWFSQTLRWPVERCHDLYGLVSVCIEITHRNCPLVVGAPVLPGALV